MLVPTLGSVRCTANRSLSPPGTSVPCGRDKHRLSAFAQQTIARRAIHLFRFSYSVEFAFGKSHSFRMPDKRCLSLRQRMTVFGFFRRGSVVDPCGRVNTRPYEAGGYRRARGYAPLRGAAFRSVGAANFNPPAGRPQILNSPFSIFNSATGLVADLIPYHRERPARAVPGVQNIEGDELYIYLSQQTC